ncbi:zinc finger protein 224-like isoform X2 [Neocloeon triangulifer]|uniref:zinc finger protein 224-like isoform X2 n=1 Tax=Neocloeon triangulifer TaxID=2078957 RepID=UPI00286F7937|nr:zinc finger protein 224-like isoform X2 [Neocloeon triangulifer]
MQAERCHSKTNPNERSRRSRLFRDPPALTRAGFIAYLHMELAEGESTITMPGTLWCYICGKRVGSSARSSTNMFQVTTTSSNQLLHKCLGNILEQDLAEEQVPTSNLCKACHKMLLSIDEVETQLNDMKEEVVGKFKKTEAMLKNGELPPADDQVLPVTKGKSGKISIFIKQEAAEAEEGVVAEKSIEPPKKSRGRPPKKAYTLAARKDTDSDNLMKRLEEIHGEEKKGEEKQIIVRVASDEEDDEEAMADLGNDSDPDFDSSQAESTEPLAKKSRARVIKVASKRAGGPIKKRGRPRDSDLGIDDTIEEEEEDEVEEPSALLNCSACELKFTEIQKLINHLKKTHDIIVYMCPFCGGDYENAEALEEHQKEAHPPEECDEESNPEYDAELDAEGDFQCELCNKLFNTMRLLKDHKKVHYGRHFACDICHKRFSSKMLLTEHVISHDGQRPFECSTCAKTFASKYCLKVHLKTHQVRPRPYQCDNCPKNFMKPEHLAQHVRTHTAKKDYLCQTCGKGFASARNLEVHAVVHTGYKPFVCRTCGKAFARRAEILDHERIHTGERPFQCETCGATFSQRSNLQSHKRATHLDDRRFVCPECNKSFKRRRLLDYHMRSVHTGERPYQCEECNATFVYPEHFKKHKRIHTGEKPFRCEVCGKAFNSRDNRNAHRFIHSNKKPYECLVCGMGFMRKPLLYSHMQSQGHVHDTIVVNQPQVPQGASTMVHEAAAAAGISGDKVYITTQDADGIEEAVETILIETPMQFAEGGTVEVSGDGPRAIILHSAEEVKDGSNVQLVQIRLEGDDTPQWINITSELTEEEQMEA